MGVKQLSVFVENKQGILSDAVKKISDADINIRAMSIADTKDFGIVRFILSDTEKAREILSEDTIVNITNVMVVKMDDKKGALHKILKVLEAEKINIDYSYAFTTSVELGACVVFRVNDVDSAEKVLNEKGFVTLDDEAMEKL